ncbi:VOC family protein [Chthonobacter albigriseus]|uniref:VOC family protein n=1 Tax=Chthonobacter albigriseus TaxID=1683161 RepID=UPI0015EF1713|nr:VOC family protein [Chthonobacter albigriseus]
MPGHGTFYWNELMTDDVEKAKAFYGDRLGWTFDVMPMSEGNYWLIRQEGVEGPVGGIMNWPAQNGMPTNYWFAYVHVDDLDDALAGVAAAGGSVLRPAWEVPGVGRIAIVKDAVGAVLGWMTPAAM